MTEGLFGLTQNIKFARLREIEVILERSSRSSRTKFSTELKSIIYKSETEIAIYVINASFRYVLR